jgi:hypothetical protein
MKKGVLVLAVLAIAATGFVGFTYAGSGDKTFEIEYQVNCNECTVSYRNEQGASTEVKAVKGNWNKKFTGSKGQFFYVSASNEAGTPVKVQIKKAGQDVIQGTSAVRDQTARAGVIL